MRREKLRAADACAFVNIVFLSNSKKKKYCQSKYSEKCVDALIETLKLCTLCILETEEAFHV